MSRKTAIMFGLALSLQGALGHDIHAATRNTKAAAAAPMVYDFEYYNTALKHFFRTADAAEAAAIDAGAAGPGWVRTGLNFNAYAAGSGPGEDVCRFYNPTANTHFFTADSAECAQVKLDPGWHYEGLSFRIQVPVGGACPAATVPVYRNYNGRFAENDSNHRFTLSLDTYNRMIKKGWKGEGAVMCAVADGAALSDFTPTSNATIAGTVNVASVNIPAGVTVTVSGDLVLNSSGPVTIAGTLAGDCKAVRVLAAAKLEVTGTIDNHCSAPPGDQDAPELVLVGNGGYDFDGSLINPAGGVLIADDVMVLTAMAEADATGVATKSRTVSLKATANTEYRCRYNIARVKAPRNGTDGASKTPTGDDAQNGPEQIYACTDDMTINSTNMTGANGGNGGKGTDARPQATKAQGGKGGDGGLLRVFADGHLTLGTNNFLNGGDGGNGGDADATSPPPPAGQPGFNATATGGPGGKAGLISVKAMDGIDVLGALNFNVGGGGHGGNAKAVASVGSSCVGAAAAKEAQPGGDAKATGGAGGDSPDKQLTTTGNVVGAAAVLVTGGGGGTGGNAAAQGGKGGDGCDKFPDGKKGGDMKADSGKGGDAQVFDLAGLPVGAGGESGDTFYIGGIGGFGFCRVPPAPGGNGGDGGTASGIAPPGGTGPGIGRIAGPGGKSNMILVANGGPGGTKGGQGGAKGANLTFAAGGVAAVLAPVFMPGANAN